MVTPRDELLIEEGVDEWAVERLLAVLDMIDGDAERGEAFMALWPIVRMAFGIGECAGLTAARERLRRYGRTERALREAVAEDLKDDRWRVRVVALAAELVAETRGGIPSKGDVAGALADLGVEGARDIVERVWGMPAFNGPWRHVVRSRTPLIDDLRARVP